MLILSLCLVAYLAWRLTLCRKLLAEARGDLEIVLTEDDQLLDLATNAIQERDAAIKQRDAAIKQRDDLAEYAHKAWHALCNQQLQIQEYQRQERLWSGGWVN